MCVARLGRARRARGHDPDSSSSQVKIPTTSPPLEQSSRSEGLQQVSDVAWENWSLRTRAHRKHVWIAIGAEKHVEDRKRARIIAAREYRMVPVVVGRGDDEPTKGTKSEADIRV